MATDTLLARLRRALANPKVRLVGRAVVVGVSVLVAQLQAADHWDGALLRAAAVAGVLAAVEVLTPLNQLVGPFKQR